MSKAPAPDQESPTLLPKPEYDVIILGAGLAGSMLGAILARHGTRVSIVDAGTHPKFAIGESMIPYTVLTLRTIAERYGVPEIATLASFNGCTKEIGTSFGWKKHFGFIRHSPGAEPDPREANQFSTPDIFNTTGHLFRQDTDAYLFNAAVRYGCEPTLAFRVTDVEVDDDQVAVKGEDGTTIRGRYLVDASGFRSPLAEKLSLRDEPCRFKHHSRSIFTHMINVPTAEAALGHAKRDQPPRPWSHGTMHHMFERGWFWVIPFNNNPQSRNPLISVGVTLDPRLYPKDSKLSAEEEFFDIASRYPAIERNFLGARSVRPWVSTGRLQYSSKSSIGPRWCLMSHAAGFLDPLFSRGMSNTAEVINALSWRLLDALREDDFSVERFSYVERLEQGLLDHNDALVNSAYIAFGSYPLWNAIFKIWAYGNFLGTFRLQRAMSAYWRTRDDNHFRELEDAPHTGLWWPDHEGYYQMYKETIAQCEAYEQGQVTAAEAADKLFGLMRDADFVVRGVGFEDPEQPFIAPNPRKMLRAGRWVTRKAPPEIRGLFLGMAKEVARSGIKARRVF